ncbi:MAG TPA: DUF1003 domain-containing protein [Candidatus Dormibacteraeota bacterium]|nr:DUF1003 domain-containing protein [Candidatus Dormibacteraeota bacterium]
MTSPDTEIPTADTDITTARQRVAAKHKHPVNQLFHDEATLGERVADRASSGIGSWWFLIIQSVLIVIWVFINTVEFFTHKWDLYPFILLNLMFSIQAAFTGPVLLLSGNRQAQKDRLRLEHTAEVAESAEKATLEILMEIERNTQATLQVLEHLKKRRESKSPSGAQS